MYEQIRVLRVIEYVGDRAALERHLKDVLYGEKTVTDKDGGTYTIKAATVGVIPEIYKSDDDAGTPVTDMLKALRDAQSQIEYLHEKFAETGSGNAVLNVIRAAIAKATTP